jgi:iron complex outermembrane receptor protein
MTLGLSQNRSAFDIDRSNAAGAQPGQSGRDAYPVYVLPRLAVQYTPSAQSTLFAHWSQGASVPTLSEVRTNEGSINRSLRPENGHNFEIGGRLHQSRFQVNGSVYYFRLSETITNYTNPQGVVLFQNAGATDQWGAELEWKWQLLPWTNPVMADMHIQQALTYQSFQFRDYLRNGEDYSGNALPGVAPYTAFTQAYAETHIGIYGALSHRWTDRLPLNDENSVYQASIHFLTARLGYQFSLSPRLSVDLFAGIDNILDQSFSFGNDLNAFGQRFFQPAPGRNYYAGIRLQYKLSSN